MNRIKIMVNGLPGNMATNVVKHALEDNRFELIPQSLTGPEITDTETIIDSITFDLIQPQDRDQSIIAIKKSRLFIERRLYPPFGSQQQCRILLPASASFCHGNNRR